MQGSILRWLYHHRLTVGATTTVMVLLISSIVVIPRSLSIYAQSSHNSSHSQYIPSSAFGDTDDLPNGTLKTQRIGLAAGSASVSGVVKDASTGNPVANVKVGISPGAVGSTAQYTTTGSDGSYSFTGIASPTNLPSKASWPLIRGHSTVGHPLTITRLLSALTPPGVHLMHRARCGDNPMDSTQTSGMAEQKTLGKSRSSMSPKATV